MTVNEVITAMRERAENMKGGPAKGALLAWVEKLEAAEPESAPTPTPPRHGTFDNRQTQHREVWVYGERGQTIPAGMCQSKPFGYYPGLD